MPSGAPTATGSAVDVAPRGVTLRTDRPHPGLLAIATFDHGDATVIVRGHLYGDGGGQVADREAPRWARWFSEHLPDLTPLSAS